MKTSEAKIFDVDLSAKRRLHASLLKSKHSSEQWVVYLPESGARFMHATRQDLKRLIGVNLAAKFNYLIINKPGQNPDRSFDAKLFEISFRRKYRLADALTTIRKLIPKGHTIHLIGYSEGAYLAPQLALLDSRVKTVSMVGGGTRGWLDEELANARPKERARMKRKIQQIESAPQSNRRWQGFSYATWWSYRNPDTLRALKLLKKPTLAILGSRDRVIDCKAAAQDLSQMSKYKPFELIKIPHCGHSFAGHWDIVHEYIELFLSQNLRR